MSSRCSRAVELRCSRELVWAIAAPSPCCLVWMKRSCESAPAGAAAARMAIESRRGQRGAQPARHTQENTAVSLASLYNV